MRKLKCQVSQISIKRRKIAEIYANEICLLSTYGITIKYEHNNV